MTDAQPRPSSSSVTDAATGRGDRLDVTVVLPCLNEEDSVAECVREALDSIHGRGWSGEVVVVDNGSSDRSAERAADAGARVVAESTPGYGAAIRRGIAVAAGDVVVMADADSTYPLDRLGELVEPVRSGEADLMVGSRLDAATRRSMPFLHRFVGTPTLTWLVREGVGATALSDSQSGFRAFRSDLATRLGLRSTGMEFASEMLIRAEQHGLTVAEIPLGYRDRVGESKLSTWRDGWRHLRLIVRLAPQVLLWKPGLVAMALGALLYLATIIWPAGIPIGSVAWQPVFIATILWVTGMLASLAGAMLARWSPLTSTTTRDRFAWVERPATLKIAMRVGATLITIGALIELAIFGAWVSSPRLPATRRLALAGLAQGLLLSGVLLVTMLAIYRLVLAERFDPDADPDSAPADSGT
ncbi:MAG: glycosyltransferase family 2 protein [Actinobacteria bacterium]|nr:glycosyltransferase family 2 protein [Actinomycetota bacterium]